MGARAEKPVEKKYVIREIVVDNTTTIRKRVELRPSTCIVCAYDVCERNGLRPYDELPVESQLRVDDALAEHKKRFHSKAEARVLRERELRALGGADNEE